TTRADEFCFAPPLNLVMVASPAEDPPFVTFVDTTTYKIVSTLKFDGTNNTPKATNGLEQCGWSPDRQLFFQNVPEVNGAGNDTSRGEITVIDASNPAMPTVVQHLPIDLDLCAGPQGMAIGPIGFFQIMEGCNAAGPNGHRNTVMVSQVGGVIGFFADNGGADEVWFNPQDNHYIIPFCNTACRTPPAPFALTFDEALAIVDSKKDGFGEGLVDQTVFVAQQYTPFFTPVLPGNPRTIHSAAAGGPNNLIIVPI